MNSRFSLVLVIGLVTVTPAVAQQAADLPRYELAVGFAPFFRADEGAEATQAPSAWITLPVGRLGVQIDYLRNVRSQSLYYLGYSHTDDQGREIRYNVARADFDVEQLVSSAIRWSFPGLGGRGYLLIGGAWQYYRRRPCVAISPGDRPEHGARVDFPPGFKCSRSPVVKSRIHAAPLYGVGVDLPLGVPVLRERAVSRAVASIPGRTTGRSRNPFLTGRRS